MWVYGAAGGGITILGTVLLHMMRGKVRGLLPGKYGGTGVKEPENSWQVFYEETEEAQNVEKAEKIRQGSAPEKIPGYVPAREKTAERQQEKQTEELQEECQTMLLTVKEEPDHMLVSAGEENEDIAVGYVPFVIGKHTGLADYILNKSTVSRFHVRITEEDGQYFLTDLNSTNGTKVNGRLLAATKKWCSVRGMKCGSQRKSTFGDRKSHKTTGGDRNRHGEGTFFWRYCRNALNKGKKLC